MTRTTVQTLLLLCLVALLAAGAAQAAKLTAAAVQPASAKPGDLATLTCTLDDPQGQVAAVTGTVKEVPYLSAPLTKGEKGAWSLAIPIPGGAPAGDYHLELTFTDAAGKAVAVEMAVPAVVALTIAGEVEKAGPPAPPAADPNPELVTTTAPNAAGETVTIRSPYRAYPNWYKGQMHCHTTNSDGKCTPPQLEAKYRQAGNDWLMITDHEVVTPDPQAEGGQDVPLFITAEEHGTAEGHTNVFAAGSHLADKACQAAINAAVAKGGLFQLNHPDWLACYDRRELDAVVGVHFMEICNAGCLGSAMHDGTRAWDYLLAKGKVIWGTATDDFHGGPQSELAKGFVVVNAPDLTAEAILANLRQGNFYASEGPALDVRVDGAAVVVKGEPGCSVFFRGPQGLAWQVSQLKAGNLTASYRLQGDEGYVRVELYRRSDGKRAWGQPIFVSK